MAQTTFRQKLALSFLGLAFTFLILEGGLRLGGWLFLNLQEKANHRAAGAGEEYRILCLGESTTALGGKNSYPRQLERILNSRQNKIKFRVINKGVPSTTTDQVLARVEIYLQEYHPHLVVAMLGVNDPPLSQPRSFADLLSERSRAIKLIRMIIAHLRVKKQELKEDALERSLKSMEARVDSRPASGDYNKLAEFYRGMNRPEKEHALILKSLALDPGNYETNFLLGVYYDRQAEYARALAAYEKAYAAQGTDKAVVLSKMAECYKFLGDYRRAEEAYLNIIGQFPGHPEAHGALADIYLEQKNYEAAQKEYVEQIKVRPDSDTAYAKLAHLYRLAGKDAAADALIKQGEKVTTDKDFDHGKAPNSRTRKNYRRLYQILRQRKIPLAAVQYPLRPFSPLEDMLSGLDGVVFVDNEKVFRDALAQGTYDMYFSDRFAGDFGHCTPQGNALLAGHIAEIILKEIIK